MSRFTVSAALSLLLAAGAWAALRPAQDMAIPTPGAEHTVLLEGVGEWEGTLTMLAPGMPQEGTPCRESVTAIGPFWTTSTFKCEFMGMPFVGSGVMGYDPEKKAYVGTWIDSMTTRLSVMEGKMDPAKKALVMSYKGPDPMTGKETTHRIETVWQADSYTSTFFMGEGEGTKHMSIAMKRKK